MDTLGRERARAAEHGAELPALCTDMEQRGDNVQMMQSKGS